jgi:hypothetical protein
VQEVGKAKKVMGVMISVFIMLGAGGNFFRSFFSLPSSQKQYKRIYGQAIYCVTRYIRRILGTAAQCLCSIKVILMLAKSFAIASLLLHQEPNSWRQP